MPKRDKAAQGKAVAKQPNNVRNKLNKRRLIQRRTTYPLRTQRDSIETDDFSALAKPLKFEPLEAPRIRKKCGKTETAATHATAASTRKAEGSCQSTAQGEAKKKP